MFSGLDRPPDCETLEYAWLVEIQMGILSGRLTMPQVMYVVKPSCTRQNNYRSTVSLSAVDMFLRALLLFISSVLF